MDWDFRTRVLAVTCAVLISAVIAGLLAFLIAHVSGNDDRERARNAQLKEQCVQRGGSFFTTNGDPICLIPPGGVR